MYVVALMADRGGRNPQGEGRWNWQPAAGAAGGLCVGL